MPLEQKIKIIEIMVLMIVILKKIDNLDSSYYNELVLVQMIVMD